MHFYIIILILTNLIEQAISREITTNTTTSQQQQQQSHKKKCPLIPLAECCTTNWSIECAPNHCLTQVIQKCPERKALLLRDLSNTKSNLNNKTFSHNSLRRSPQKIDEPKCGTAEMNYHPCTSKSVANKLFLSCCELYVPPECQFMCQYETEQNKAKLLLTTMVKSKCSFKHISAILYCASQNRDNRQCCQDLDLNSSQLMVGSRCLRMCDPSGTSLSKITKEDVTCLFNWNVIMYCHHSGIREM